MRDVSNVSKTDSRKPYPKPSYTQLAAEQAKSFLVERANRGRQAAKEMLELMFPDAAEPKDTPTESVAQL